MRRFGIALGVALCTLMAVDTCGAITSKPTTEAAKKKKKKRSAPKKSAATRATTPVKSAAVKSRVAVSAALRSPVARPATSQFVPSRSHKQVRIAYSPWTSPTFADSTMGDSVDGEDLVVRRAAVDALGAYNGTVVVADPSSGRILSIVNQKLALNTGFQPCSTVKVVCALAALSEGIVDRETPLRLSKYKTMNLTRGVKLASSAFVFGYCRW